MSSNNNKLRRFFFILASCLAAGFAFCADGVAQRGTGLETAGATVIPVEVEDLSPSAQKLGLTRELIEATANSILRKNGLKPFDDSKFTMDYYLYVRVSVVGNAFSVALHFCREVTYKVGDANYFYHTSTTWKHSTLGQARNSTYILDAVSEQTEIFCNAYLKANGK